MNSKCGFISIHLSFFLTIFLSLYMTMAITFSVLQKKDVSRKICIEESINIQQKVLKSTRLLFGLNKYSTFLRVNIIATKAAIVAATVTLNFPLVSALNRYLQFCYRIQKNLDSAQKALIKTTELYITNSKAILLAKINKASFDQSQKWSFLLNSVSFTKINKSMSYPIQADSKGGLAPNYEWKPNAESELELAYSWQLLFSSQRSFQSILKWDNRYKMKCGTNVQIRGNKWFIKILEDKF
ncbi:MAG: hypothetical protein ACK4VO_12060 [Pseudobdellovibrio sp.]